jgi:D-glucuronyl C5-epimerase C-terminus
MLVPLIAAFALLMAAPPGLAGDHVLVVKGDRIEQRWDPYLPPDPQPLRPDPPSATARAAAKGPIRQALSRALENGKISERGHRRYTRILNSAHSLYDRGSVGQRCRTQVGRVLGVMTAIAQRGSLSPSRMPALFLQLRRNVEFWEQEPDIRLAERVSFEDDPLLLQHYAGYGLQIQPLGNFGKANGLWTECQERPRDCKRKMLRALLTSMLRVASRRGGFKAWEYWFPFGGGYPPWASGMAQATGMQALARGATFFSEPRFMKAAAGALPLFLKPPPLGVRVHSGRRGSHYLLYSFSSGLRVLNGFLQAVTGLYDYAKLNDDGRALRLFRAGDRAARRETPRYDTGNWSYYALPNRNLSTWDYHVLVTGFLENLCERTGARVYCRTARRFARYSAQRGGPPPPSSSTPGSGRRCGYL